MQDGKPHCQTGRVPGKRAGGDVKGATGYAVAALAGLVMLPPSVAATWSTPVRLLAALACAGLVFRVLLHRRNPARALPLLGLLLVIALVADAAVVAVLLLFEALYATTVYGSRRPRLVVYTLAALVNVLLLAPELIEDPWRPEVSFVTVQTIVFCVLAIWWGQSVRHLNERADNEQAHAAVQAEIGDKERQLSETRSILAVTAERASFARDMHDLVAGRLAVISLQAAMAEQFPDDRERVARLLDRIHECSDTTLDEVRAMITALADDRLGAAPLRTVNGSRYLMQTVAAVGTVGVRVEVDDRLAANQDARTLTLYVVAQELVVNMLRHAAPCEGRISLDAVGGVLVLEARNTLAPQPGGVVPLFEPLRVPQGTGNGLRNIADRLAPLGGTARVDPDASDGSFLVTVRLPGPPAPIADDALSPPAGSAQGGDDRRGEPAVLVEEEARPTRARELRQGPG